MNAVSLALIDAGIAMKDTICACSVGIVNRKDICLDLTANEQNSNGSIYIPGLSVLIESFLLSIFA